MLKKALITILTVFILNPNAASFTEISTFTEDGDADACVVLFNDEDWRLTYFISINEDLNAILIGDITDGTIDTFTVPSQLDINNDNWSFDLSQKFIDDDDNWEIICNNYENGSYIVDDDETILLSKTGNYNLTLGFNGNNTYLEERHYDHPEEGTNTYKYYLLRKDIDETSYTPTKNKSIRRTELSFIEKANLIQLEQSAKSDMDLQIRDFRGRVVYKSTLSAECKSAPLPDLAKGVYIANASNKNVKTNNLKVIKK